MTNAYRRAAAATGLMALLLAALLSLLGPAPAGARELGVPLAGSAPKVSKQPANVTALEGQPATFNSTASGSPTPTLQWQVSVDGGSTWSPVEGATSSPLTIAAATASQNGWQYRAVFTNTLGEAISKAATLTVQAPPTITHQPSSVTVEQGQSTSFTASASGLPAPTVQWQVSTNGGNSWSNASNGTSETLKISFAVNTENGWQYRAVFKNSAGTVTSEVATLNVATRPAMSTQPTSTTVHTGATAEFEATATGQPTPTPQWELSTNGGASWSPIEGAVSTQLKIPSVQPGMSGYEYRVTFTNTVNSVTSQVATLTVQTPPAITTQPAGDTVEAGETATFEAAASGTPAPTVSWQVSTDGGSSWSTIAGATNTRLELESVTSSQNRYEYRAVFTNPAGTAESLPATLTVATSHYSAQAWGEDTYGQLGDGEFGSWEDTPVTVSGLRYVTAVAAGNHFSLALLADGQVMAWGFNGSDDLGNANAGQTSDRPVPVEGLTNVVAIAAGSNHSLALLADGTVMAWGDNESGQLGDGRTTEEEGPVAVHGLSGVKAIAAGGDFSLALLENGNVMAWGSNESGQLGNGNLHDSSTPAQVHGLGGVTAIAAGEEFALARLQNGTVEAWGSDDAQQLGNVAVEEEGLSTTPVPVTELEGVASVAAGNEHALALLEDGTVLAWGAGGYGELGGGVLVNSQMTPTPVQGLSEVQAIDAGMRDSAALLKSGTVMTWGQNKHGTLGDGMAGESSDVPVMVSGLQGTVGISAGGSQMLAFGEPLPEVDSVEPAAGSVSGGTHVTIHGGGLAGATAVHFGTHAAASFSVVSADTVTAVSPAGTGTVDVTVTTGSGTSPTVVGDRFTYETTPTVKKLAPKVGLAGTSVTITGANFSGATGVSFGAVPASSFTINSPTSITAVAPASSSGGAVDVTVSNGAGASPIVKKDVFTYTPAIEAVSPASGPASGGTLVSVTGTGFAPGATTFKFGKKKSPHVECTSATSCTAQAPAGTAGTVDITATAGKATSAEGTSDHYTYE